MYDNAPDANLLIDGPHRWTPRWPSSVPSRIDWSIERGSGCGWVWRRSQPSGLAHWVMNPGEVAHVYACKALSAIAPASAICLLRTAWGRKWAGAMAVVSAASIVIGTAVQSGFVGTSIVPETVICIAFLYSHAAHLARIPSGRVCPRVVHRARTGCLPGFCNPQRAERRHPLLRPDPLRRALLGTATVRPVAKRPGFSCRHGSSRTAGGRISGPRREPRRGGLHRR